MKAQVRIRGFLLTLYGRLQDGLIVRVYDRQGYMHIQIDLLKNRRKDSPVFWHERHRDWNGNLIWRVR